MVLVAEATFVPQWGCLEDSTVFARNEHGELYVCSWNEYKEDEGSRWHSNSLEEAINYYRQHHDDWEVNIYE